MKSDRTSDVAICIDTDAKPGRGIEAFAEALLAIARERLEHKASAAPDQADAGKAVRT